MKAKKKTFLLYRNENFIIRPKLLENYVLLICESQLTNFNFQATLV
jgi:hypothetical protein